MLSSLKLIHLVEVWVGGSVLSIQLLLVQKTRVYGQRRPIALLVGKEIMLTAQPRVSIRVAGGIRNTMKIGRRNDEWRRVSTAAGWPHVREEQDRTILVFCSSDFPFLKVLGWLQARRWIFWQGLLFLQERSSQDQQSILWIWSSPWRVYWLDSLAPILFGILMIKILLNK